MDDATHQRRRIRYRTLLRSTKRYSVIIDSVAGSSLFSYNFWSIHFIIINTVVFVFVLVCVCVCVCACAYTTCSVRTWRTMTTWLCQVRKKRRFLTSFFHTVHAHIVFCCDSHNEISSRSTWSVAISPSIVWQTFQKWYFLSLYQYDDVVLKREFDSQLSGSTRVKVKFSSMSLCEQIQYLRKTGYSNVAICSFVPIVGEVIAIGKGLFSSC